MSSGLYYADMLDVLRAAGCGVAENSITNGWQTRARSSGGFSSPPLGIQWHHTASQASPQNDLSWMIDGSDDAPIGNLLLDRSGVFWPVAAGAANTAGKGGPVTMSRGVVPVDSGNSRTFAFEVANNGVGEPWPVEQIDAYFAGSNALNAHFGNQPTDVFTHSLGDGDGWTDRKIDPATATAVEGPWQPRSVNGSGTWSLTDIRAECARRAGSTQPVPEPEPEPEPQPTREIDMYLIGALGPNSPAGSQTPTVIRVGPDTLTWEANSNAQGIDMWFGVPYKEAGEADVSSLCISRRATNDLPSDCRDPNSPYYCPQLAAAWRP